MPQMITEVVVVVTGAFEGVAVDKWGRLISEMVALAPRRVVVDLRACPVADAAAIAILLGAHRALIHAGGRMTLRGPTSRVRRNLCLARLDRVFDVEDAEPAEPVDA